MVYQMLPPGIRGMWQGRVIVLDSTLDRVERRCTLMHELVHFERGIGWPDATEATMVREEAKVRREVAARLVPAGELADLVRCRHPEPVSARMVAEEFDVTEQVAAEAMRMLQMR